MCAHKSTERRRPYICRSRNEKLRALYFGKVYECPNSTRRARPNFIAGRVWSCRFEIPVQEPDQTRPMDRLGLRQVRELCLVVDLSAKSRHVRPLSVGLVWSGRRQSPWVRAVEFDMDQTLSETWSQARTCLVESGRLHVVAFINDTTRPDQRQRLVEPVSNSTTWTQNGPDRTRPDPTRPTRVSDKV